MDIIKYLNFFIAGLVILFLILTGFLWLSETPVAYEPERPPKKTFIPKIEFDISQEEYDSIGPPFLSLRFAPMTLQLPDLRNVLVYYGKNERPDVSKDKSLLFFSFLNSSETAAISPDQHLYLIYDKDKPQVKYLFSPNNAATSLWIDASPLEKEALINLSMKNEAGEIIRKPEQNAQFRVKEKEFLRVGMDKWEIGGMRVDGTLLARQKARWYGKDLFLEKHGGEEYQNLMNKQRVDFGEKEDTYSVFVGQGGSLAWKDGKWVEIAPGEESRKYPLLVLNKIEERLLKFDLWDTEGKIKIPMNLMKSTDSFPALNIEKNFKFLGSRTRSQFMFEVNNERILVSPKDWFLFIDNNWRKLTTPEEIDEYVERKAIGPLFVVDDIRREDGRQVLLGTIFNSSRTELKSIEIPLQQAGTPAQTGNNPAKASPTSGAGAGNRQPPQKRVNQPPRNQYDDYDDYDDDEEDFRPDRRQK